MPSPCLPCLYSFYADVSLFETQPAAQRQDPASPAPLPLTCALDRSPDSAVLVRCNVCVHSLIVSFLSLYCCEHVQAAGGHGFPDAVPGEAAELDTHPNQRLATSLSLLPLHNALAETGDAAASNCEEYSSVVAPSSDRPFTRPACADTHRRKRCVGCGHCKMAGCCTCPTARVPRKYTKKPPGSRKPPARKPEGCAKWHLRSNGKCPENCGGCMRHHFPSCPCDGLQLAADLPESEGDGDSDADVAVEAPVLRSPVRLRAQRPAPGALKEPRHGVPTPG